MWGYCHKHNSKNHQRQSSQRQSGKSAKFSKTLRQLEVVSSTGDGFPDDLEGYVEPDPYQNQPAAFVPSKCLTEEYHLS